MYAKCSKSTLLHGPESSSTTAAPNPHQYSKVFHLQTPARDWWLPAQHDFPHSDDTEKKLVILDTAQRVPWTWKEKVKWLANTTLGSHSQNQEHDFRFCASQLSAPFLGSAQIQGELRVLLQRAWNPKHYIKKRQDKGEKQSNSIICNTFYKPIAHLHLQ